MEGIISKIPFNLLLKKEDKNVLITRQMGDGTMRIDHDALRQILIRPEIGDRPVAIISIAGCMRTGKSFLLNFLIRYLKEEGWKNKDWMGDNNTSTSNGPKWSSGRQRVTVGISIWQKVFYVPQPDNGREMAVLIMDTQGLFDNKTPENVNTALLTLSTLASSVQIFNTKEHINSHNLDYLKTCVDFAMITAKLEEPFFQLQVLNFLVRDTPDENDDESAFGMENGERYLNEILESTDGGEDQIRIRKGIKDSFTKVSCFCLPYPGELATKKKFVGRNDELKPEFRKWVDMYVASIASPEHLQPKLAKGKNEMSAREILNMITACDETFSGGEYKASNLKQANIKAYYSSEYENSLLVYDKMTKNAIGRDRYMKEKELERKHKEAKVMAMRRYNSAKEMGDGDCRRSYEKHLESMCNEHFGILKTKNESMRREIELKEAQRTAKAIAEYQSAIHQVTCEGIVDPNLLQRSNEQYLQAIRKKYKSKANMGKLEMEAKKYFDEIFAQNEERIQAQRQIKEERRQKLYQLKIVLMHTSEKKWIEVSTIISNS